MYVNDSALLGELVVMARGCDYCTV